ncbi:MAG: translation initiation factor IF-2 [Prevotellaceae bacterium]|nr:translation initiation factor IF-2 [Prevotellaceae bacterium]
MINNIRISKILSDFNIGISTLVEFLKKKGVEVEANPNKRVSEDVYNMIASNPEFKKGRDIKEGSRNIIPRTPVSVSSVSISDIEKPQDIFDEPDTERTLSVKTNIVAPSDEITKIGVKIPEEQFVLKSHEPAAAPKSQPEPQAKEKVAPAKDREKEKEKDARAETGGRKRDAHPPAAATTAQPPAAATAAQPSAAATTAQPSAAATTAQSLAAAATATTAQSPAVATTAQPPAAATAAQPPAATTTAQPPAAATVAQPPAAATTAQPSAAATTAATVPPVAAQETQPTGSVETQPTGESKRTAKEPETAAVRAEKTESRKVEVAETRAASEKRTEKSEKQPEKSDARKEESKENTLITAKQNAGELRGIKVLNTINLDEIGKTAGKKSRRRDRNKNKNQDSKNQDSKNKERPASQKTQETAPVASSGRENRDAREGKDNRGGRDNRGNKEHDNRSGRNSENRPARENDGRTGRDRDRDKANDKLLAAKEPAAEKKEPAVEKVEKKEPEFIETKVRQLAGPKVVGNIDLGQFARKTDASKDKGGSKRGKRQRIAPKSGKVNVADEAKQKQLRDRKDVKDTRPKDARPNDGRPNDGRNAPRDDNRNAHSKPGAPGTHGAPGAPGAPDNRTAPARDTRDRKERFKPILHRPVDDDAVQRQVKDTLARLTAGKGQKTKSSKYRREKRDAVSQKAMAEQELRKIASNTLKVTEFVTVNELATMMNIPVTKVIGACMNLGLMVSINQRLDAEALVLVAEEFGFSVEFVTAELKNSIEVEIDRDDELVSRPPIITVMGHVDHGKTSLLDNIRKTNVIAGEAGGITQHIGAYSVEVDGGRRITFLDTPGHEAFTAMRARGAKVTDLVIIIVAADDAVMPQTVEAINHAVAAGVPMIFAINKVDKPGANPEKIREQLAAMNFLVEEWGGKYQSQEIAAKQGLNVDKLLEKVLLEADLLELKANPDKRASGTVIESSLDKGRGYVTTLLVHGGTLKPGDVVISGIYTGRVKAMFDERNNRIESAGPSTPVLMLGLNGAPAAGETFNVMADEKEAREIAGKREQLIRMQDIRTRKHITLEEIGRRIAIGSFKELNVVVKADVDGSMEAIADSLIKLSTEEVQVNIIHKAVGAISESDVLLAAASNAIIIGFQVRPSAGARRLAEKEEIDIRLYSVIYDAINQVRDGIEGMLAPELKEEITATVEVLEIFKITKVGTVAGCIVREGKIARHSKIRLIRDGIVIYSGTLGSLKRFKDDVKEVLSGYECGLNIDRFNDVKTGDVIEAYEEVEIKRKL